MAWYTRSMLVRSAKMPNTAAPNPPMPNRSGCGRRSAKRAVNSETTFALHSPKGSRKSILAHAKGVGRIYQQTFVDTYAKVAFAKLYTTKTPIASADLLNDRVLPFYQEHQVALLHVLTDRGTEYCGKVEQHDYQLYLAVNDIDHTRTKALKIQSLRSSFASHNQRFPSLTLRRSEDPLRSNRTSFPRFVEVTGVRAFRHRRAARATAAAFLTGSFSSVGERSVT
jgi:hypothetical protein